MRMRLPDGWRRLGAALLCLVCVGVPAAHAQPAPAPTPGPGTLRASIGLTEVRLDNGGIQSPLPFGTFTQDVDINSVVNIAVRSDRVASALGPGPVLAPQHVRALTAASQALREAAPAILQAFDSAARLVGMDARGQRSGDEFTQLAAQAQEQFGALSRASQAYRDALRGSNDTALQQRADQFEATRSRTIEMATDPNRPPGGASALLAAMLVSEADWIVAELQQRGEETARRLRGVALVLFAQYPRSGSLEPVHLEHYDSLPQGVPVPYEKIRAVPSPEDEAEMKAIYAEAQEWVGLLTQLQARRASLGQSLQAAAAQAGLDVQPLLTALQQARTALLQAAATDWADAARQLAHAIDQELQTNPGTAQTRAQLQALRARAAALIERADAARGGALDIIQRLGGLMSLDGLEQLSHAPTSIDGLVGLLQALDARGRLLADGLQALQQLPATVDALVADLQALAAAAREAVASAATVLREEGRAALRGPLEQLAAEQFGPLIAALQLVASDAVTLARRAAELFGRSGGPAEAYAAADFEVPDTSFYVSGERLVDTFLDLRTLAGRREGDTVVIVAKLYRVRPVTEGAAAGGSTGAAAGGAPGTADVTSADDSGLLSAGIIGEELDSEVQPLRIVRFGWFNGPGGGPAYVVSSFRREADGPRIRQFAPMVTWMLRRQGWPQVGDGARPQRAGMPWLLSAGVHTVVLDLNGDNQQEIGVGAAVSVFRDLLQVGWGWDVGLGDRPYWYVGFRLVRVGGATGGKGIGNG